MKARSAVYEIQDLSVARPDRRSGPALKRPFDMVLSGAGLLGRFGLDEGTGTVATNSVVTSPLSDGTLAPAVNGSIGPPTWVAGGSPFVPSGARPADRCLRQQDPLPDRCF